MMVYILNSILKLSTKLFKKDLYHLTRYKMYSDLSKNILIENRNTVASVSGSQKMALLLGFDSNNITNIDYPDASILNIPYKQNSFDAIVADQVLEHVSGSPWVAVAEMARVVKPGGFVVIGTVAAYPLHYGPEDLLRFTPEGLRKIVTDAGLDVVHEGSWGGRMAVLFVYLGLGQLSVPSPKWHPIHRLAISEGGKSPVVVWIVARKRSL